MQEVEFGGKIIELGANWIQYHGLEKGQENPLRKMAEDAGLYTVVDDYEDYVFRFNGLDVTDDYDKIYSRLENAEEGAVNLAKMKIDRNESDVTFRTAFRLNEWNPTHPLEHAAEWFDFDFEFADAPDHTSLKANYRVKYISVVLGHIKTQSHPLLPLDIQRGLR